MSEESINKKDYDLSILMTSITERVDTACQLIKHIQKQIDDCEANEKVQLIISMDNRSVPLINKRNKAQKRARGKYLCHMDDDDWVSDNFIKVLLEHIPKAYKRKADVICYKQLAKLNGGKRIIITPSLNGPYPMKIMGVHKDPESKSTTIEDHIANYSKIPWQWSCWRTELVRDVVRTQRLESGALWEDLDWIQRVLFENPKIQYDIDEVLHIYYGDSEVRKNVSEFGW